MLETCLKSLHNQNIPQDSFEILVIDNAGEEKVEDISVTYGARYVMEPKTGLSHARNRGWKEARTPWVLYLDDDAIAPTDLLEKVIYRTQNEEIDMIGGRFTHWFLKKPAKWLLYIYHEDGYRPSPMRRYGLLSEGHYLVGGILATRRALLERLNGFNPRLGMRGNSIGWAEEDELQDRARHTGYRIAYDPDIVIEHLVQPYKYKLINQIKMTYANGRDGGHGKSGGNLLILFRDLLRVLAINLPYDVLRWLFRPGFYWQNAVVNSGGRIAFLFGRYKNRRWSDN